MSKKHKEKKVTDLADLSNLVDVASLPAVEELPAKVEDLGRRSYNPAEASHDETAVAEIAEVITTNVDEAVATIDSMIAEQDAIDAATLAPTDACEDHGLIVDVADIAVDGPVIASIRSYNLVEAAETIAAEPPEEPPTDPPVLAEALTGADLIANLQAKIAALKEDRAKRVASGSKPRPNVTYTLLDKPLAWSSTPQVAQLQQILFDEKFLADHRQSDGAVKIAEPDLFAAISAGAAAGALRTKQEPIRIFQYYRSHLLNANCLRWA